LDASDAEHLAWGQALEQVQIRCDAVAPRVLASEAGNVVHGKRAAEFGATAAERSERLEWLLATVRLVDSDAEARRRSGAIAEAERLSFYDAEFLELALRDAEALLLTQDHRLLATGKRRLGARRALSLDAVSEALERGAL
jgi:predicted nucleic acid-binding protein